MAAAEYGLMHDAIQRELDAQLRWYQAPWVAMAERAPPGPDTYLVTYEADGRRSVALKYWSVPVEGCQFPRAPYWADVGPMVTVLAWAPEPGAWRG